MDVSKFLGKFKDATEDHLQRMNRLLLALEQEPDRPAEISELLREIHTLKGEARMMGFGDISDVAHAVEDVLKAQEAEGFAGLSSVTDDLFAAFDAVEALLAEKLGGEGAAVDVPRTCQGLRDLVAGGPPPDAPAAPIPVSAPATDGGTESFGDLDLGDLSLPDEGAAGAATAAPEDAEAAMKEAFGVPEAAARPAPPATPRVSLGGGTERFLGKFADAARERVQRMNALVLRLETDPASSDDVAELLREIHTLKGESRMMGFGDIAELCHAIEDVFRSLAESGWTNLPAVADVLFDALDATGRLVEGRLAQEPADVDLPTVLARLEGARAGRETPPPSGAGRAAEPAGEARPSGAAPALEPVDPFLAESFLASAREQVTPLLALLEEEDREGAASAVERTARALGAEARFAGFEVLAGLLTALGAAAGAGRVHVLRSALQAVEPAIRDRAEGRDPSARLARLVDELEGRDASTDGAARAATGGAAQEAGSAQEDDDAGAGDAVDGAAHGAAALDAEREAPAEPPPGVGVIRPPEARPRSGDESRPIRSLRLPDAERGRNGAAAASAPKVDQTLRISLAKLEELGNLTSDIYLNHTRAEDRQRSLREVLEVTGHQARAALSLRQAVGRQSGEAGSAGGALADACEAILDTQRTMRRSLQDMLRTDRDDYLHAGQLIVGLRERVRALQMLSVSTLFDMYPRMVRDIAKELGKRVRLGVEGADTELDRRVLDEIRDPMVHLLRNAIDHGIERPDEREAAGKPAQGRVDLAARTEGDHVVIEIRDDGAGIDPATLRRLAIGKGVLTEGEARVLTDDQALQLIFAPGFSSKEAVSDLSGRGVGMDVVRQKVESLEGRIGLDSEPGRGTRLSLRLPLTLAMARVLLLRAGGLLLAVPATFVAEVLKVDEQVVRRVESYEAIEWHDRTIPIVSLANVLQREARPAEPGTRAVVVVGFEEHVVGFEVDRLQGEREVVVKRLSEFLGRVRNVAGATILSSGEIVVVLHVPQLIAATMGVSPLSLRARLQASPEPETPAQRRPRLLVVDDSIIVRDMMKAVLEGAGFEVTLAVDGMDGLEKQLGLPHDLVITDVEMPRMDGFELTRSLKQNEAQADVPIIIVTTLDSAESKARGLQAGASAYVVKNLLDMSQLVETIERLVS